jgi:hypothetical protein
VDSTQYSAQKTGEDDGVYAELPQLVLERGFVESVPIGLVDVDVRVEDVQ